MALGRKNALFAGSDGGAHPWATVASLVATAKLNGVEPLAWLIPTAGSSDGRSAPHVTAVWAGSICQELARPV
jgi:hypothetical protein